MNILTGANRGRGAVWWTLAPLRSYARFSGRARRKEYWYFAIASFTMSMVLTILDVATNTYREEWGFGLLSGLFSAAIVIPAWAVEVRRLHDIGFSGWWMLVLLIPVVGLVGLTVAACIDGEIGPNSYGTDPKAAENARRIVKQSKVRGAAIVVLSLGLSIPACWILVVVLTYLYPPPLGHYSPLTGRAGIYILALVLVIIVLMPVTLLIGARSLMSSKWREPTGRLGGGFGMVLTGMILAALALGSCLLSWWLLLDVQQ